MNEKVTCKLCDCNQFSSKGGLFAKKTCKNCKHKLEDHVISEEKLSTSIPSLNLQRMNLDVNILPPLNLQKSNSPRNESPKYKEPASSIFFTPRSGIEKRRMTLTGSISTLSTENLSKNLNIDFPSKESKSTNKISPSLTRINGPNSPHEKSPGDNTEKSDKNSSTKLNTQPQPKLIEKMRTISQKFNKTKMQDIQNDEESNQNLSYATKNNTLDLRKMIIAKKEEEKKLFKKKKKERNLQPQEVHLEWLLEKVLRGLNVDESSTKVIVKKVVQTALSKKPMEPFAVLSLFNSILDRTEDIMTSMTCGSEIVKIQSLVRRYLAIKKFKPKIEYWRKHKERLNLYHSLLKTEATFNKNLDVVISCYIEPLIKLEKSNKLPISAENMKKIFGNFTNIAQAHSSFLHEMYMLKLGWPYIETIGTSFRGLLDTVEELYEEYSKNYCYAKDTLSLCLKESDKFASFISEVQNVTQTRGITDMDIRNLLTLPLTRVQQYNFQIQDLCLNTPKDHPDYNELIDCRNVVRKLRKTTNDNVNENLVHSKSLLIEQRLLNLEEIELLRNEKEILLEGFLEELVQEGEKPQKRYLFLFNGALLVTKYISNKKYKLKQRVEGDDLNVQSLPDVNTRKNFLKIAKLTFIAKSSEDKDYWVNGISKIVSDRILKEMVFGAPLEVVLRREKRLQSGIPKVVQDCIEMMKSDLSNLATDGIFRVTGNSNITQQMQYMVDHDKGKCSYDLETLKPGVHELTTITKLYLRELPVPLIPFQFYDSFVEIGKSQVTGQAFFNKISPELEKFPPENRKLLSYLLHFLNLVASFSDKNRMKVHNLGIVFGPTLLRPQVQSMDTALQFDFVTHVIDQLIENASLVFPDEKQENHLSDDEQNETNKISEGFTSQVLTEEEVKKFQRKHSKMNSELFLVDTSRRESYRNSNNKNHSSSKLINLQEFGKSMRVRGFSAKNEIPSGIIMKTPPEEKKDNNVETTPNSSQKSSKDLQDGSSSESNSSTPVETLKQLFQDPKKPSYGDVIIENNYLLESILSKESREDILTEGESYLMSNRDDVITEYNEKDYKDIEMKENRISVGSFKNESNNAIEIKENSIETNDINEDIIQKDKSDSSSSSSSEISSFSKTKFGDSTDESDLQIDSRDSKDNIKFLTSPPTNIVEKRVSSSDDEDEKEGSLIPEINRLTLGIQEDDDSSSISCSGEEVKETGDEKSNKDK